MAIVDDGVPQESNEPRFVVEAGPPTWVVIDRANGRILGWPYPDQDAAKRQAEQLNCTHRNFRVEY